MKSLALGVVMVVGWCIGALASGWFVIYMICFVCFVASNSGDPGPVAHTPKVLFLLCPLIFLGKTKTLKGSLTFLICLLDPEVKEEWEARSQKKRWFQRTTQKITRRKRKAKVYPFAFSLLRYPRKLFISFSASFLDFTHFILLSRLNQVICRLA